MAREYKRLLDRARRLDDAILGRRVADQRSFAEQIRRPRSAVWSRRGRTAYAVILLGMLAAIIWLPDVMGVIAIVILVTAAFVVVAADERQRGLHSSSRAKAVEGVPKTSQRSDPGPPDI